MLYANSVPPQKIIINECMLRVWLFSFQENVELPTSNIPVIDNTYDPCNTRTSLMPKNY